MLCGAAAAFGVVAPAAAGSILTADRATSWTPGLTAVGGTPRRSTICATVSPQGNGRDDAARIQSAIDDCQSGQVVELTEGTFIISEGNFLLIDKAITLRGAGPVRTKLVKPDGAKPFQESVSAKPSPLVIVGPSRYPWTSNADDNTASRSLTADAVKGASEVTVDNPEGLAAGQIVLLDEASGALWQDDPQGRGRIWAAPDWRVVWQKHDPPLPFVDHFAPDTFPSTPGTAGSWFSRTDRPTAEVKQIAAASGSTITFTTPIHITYRKSHAAQLFRYGSPHVTFAGVEDLTLSGGDNGNLRFEQAAHSWARNLESTQWHGEGISIAGSFGIELREFYVHDGAWAQPGGGGYGISLSAGSSEILIENGIVVRANKLIVSRSAGAGSVVGYNYMDMSYINTNGAWIEVGLNASHMVGSHHVLFEGNDSHNADSDKTHGNSIYLTFFRNHFSCIRAPFENQAGGMIDDAVQSRNGPKRCAGAMAYSYWMSFVGNVLGSAGRMEGWSNETTFLNGKPGIWMLGWDDVEPYPTDLKVSATALRHGNFDFVTGSQRWALEIADRKLPDSLYLKGKPSFFNAGRGYPWPWVDPSGPTKLRELPAKARYDAGTPFAQP